MKEVEVKNAKIRKTTLGIEDHGILTCYVHLEGDGWGVGFGGFTLDGPIKRGNEFSHREGTAYGMEFINRVLKTLEINSWEKLPGAIVRCKSEGWGGRCLAIGHPLKEQWFEPEADLAHLAR